MDNKKWTAVAAVLLLASIVTSVIFIVQRNEARQRWRESREQIADLNRRNDQLQESLADQESRLRAEADFAQKKQAALTAVETQIKELKARLDKRQFELDAVSTQLQQSTDETARLERMLATAEERAADLANERDRLIAQTTVLKTEGGDLRASIVEMEKAHREALTGREEEISDLSSALKACEVKMDDLKKEKDVLTLNLDEANRTITGLRDQLQEVIVLVPALKDRLKQSLEKYQVVSENLVEATARQAELEAQQKAMREAYENLVTELRQQLDTQDVTIEKYRERLKVSFVDRILFGFSQVHVSPEGNAALDQLAEVLATVPEGNIRIVGHADSIPVAPKFQYRFPSNWELSSARAAAVARHLLKKGKLEPSRIEVVGLSSYQPITDNDTEEGRAKNRRVEIIITQGRYSNN